MHDKPMSPAMRHIYRRTYEKEGYNNMSTGAHVVTGGHILQEHIFTGAHFVIGGHILQEHIFTGAHFVIGGHILEDDTVTTAQYFYRSINIVR